MLVFESMPLFEIIMMIVGVAVGVFGGILELKHHVRNELSVNDYLSSKFLLTLTFIIIGIIILILGSLTSKNTGIYRFPIPTHFLFGYVVYVCMSGFLVFSHHSSKEKMVEE